MHLSSSAAFAALAALCSTNAVMAHIGRGVADTPLQPRHHAHIEQRGLRPTGVKRAATAASPTDEASAATITNTAEECTAYSLPSMNKISKEFPTVWTTAKIVSGDTQANNTWAAIQKSGIIPTDVAQKGSGGKGDFTGITYSASSDPDCWWTESQCVTPKHKNIPDDIWQCAEPETWGLTFDDGPNCSHNAFYDYLLEQKQKATLFYIGSNVMDWPLEAQRGIVEGHHVCVHTWSHQYMTQLTNEEVFAELYYTGKAIKDITGVTPRCWRPPYGDVDDRVRAIATGLGMSTNLWSGDTDDWQVLPYGTEPTSKIKANYASIINEKGYNQHGNIVLTHEINGPTMKMFMTMYPKIKAAFKYIVPLTACMNITQPYPEAITYPNFAQYIAGNISPTGEPTSSNVTVSDATYSPLNAAASQTSSAGSSRSSTDSSSSQKSSAGGLHTPTVIVYTLLAGLAVVVVTMSAMA